MTFYHGTARKFRIGEALVPPKEHGFEISEKGRKKNLDKVFFTSDVGSAKIYARRAVNSYGGIPHIYEVEVPNVDIEVINPTPGTTVYAAPRATIVGEVEFEKPMEDIFENWRDFFNKEPEPKEERIPPIPSRYLKSIRGWQWKDENWSSLRSSGWTLISWRTMRRPSEQPPWAIRSNDPSRNVGRWVSPPGDLSRDPKLFPVPYILWLEQKHKPWIEKVNRSLENGDMSLEGLKQLKNQVLQSWSTESNDKAIKKALEMALERIKKDFLELNIKYGGAKGGLSLAKVPGAEGALSRPEPSEKGAISLAEIWRKFLV